MNLKLLGLLSFLLACLGSGYLGYQIASTSYELEISHIREQSKEQEALALQNKNELKVRLRYLAIELLQLIAILTPGLIAILLLITVSACTTVKTMPVATQVCPQLPALPEQFQTVNVDAMERTQKNFADYISSN